MDFTKVSQDSAILFAIAIKTIDEQFEPGYAKRNPLLVAALVQVITTLYIR